MMMFQHEIFAHEEGKLVELLGDAMNNNLKHNVDLLHSDVSKIIIDNGMTSSILERLFTRRDAGVPIHQKLQSVYQDNDAARKPVYEAVLKSFAHDFEWFGVKDPRIWDVANTLTRDSVKTLVDKYKDDPRSGYLMENIAQVARFTPEKDRVVDVMTQVALAYDDNPEAQKVAMEEMRKNVSPWPVMARMIGEAYLRESVKSCMNHLKDDQYAVKAAMEKIAYYAYGEGEIVGRIDAIANAIVKDYDSVYEAEMGILMGPRSYETIIVRGKSQTEAIGGRSKAFAEANASITAIQKIATEAILPYEPGCGRECLEKEKKKQLNI